MTNEFFDQAEESIAAQKEADEKADNAESWPTKKTEPGTVIRGRVLDAKYLPLEHGWTPMLIVESLDEQDDNGDPVVYKVWGSRSVLGKEIIDSQPAPGSLIVITYEGKRETKSGARSYHLYMVRAQRADPAFWSKLTSGKTGPTGKKPAVSDDDLPDPFAS